MEQCNRGESEQSRDPLESLFLLKKSSSSSTASIQVDFSPLNYKDSPNMCNKKTLPIFNLDNKHFTPSFILQVDQERYQQNEQIYYQLHNRKSSEMSEQKEQLYVPKPSKNNSFCCICKTPFEDYLTHLNLPKHILSMKKSEFYTKIHQLCQKITPNSFNLTNIPKKKGRPAKTNKPIDSSKKTKTKRIDKLKKLSSRVTCSQESHKQQKMVILTVS